MQRLSTLIYDITRLKQAKAKGSTRYDIQRSSFLTTAAKGVLIHFQQLFLIICFFCIEYFTIKN